MGINTHAPPSPHPPPAPDSFPRHRCTVSDLEDEQVFYFLSRGIDEDAARAALVYSFGMEVINRIGLKGLRERLEKLTKQALEAAKA